jgi:hypothetical protein
MMDDLKLCQIPTCVVVRRSRCDAKRHLVDGTLGAHIQIELDFQKLHRDKQNNINKTEIGKNNAFRCLDYLA